MREKQIDVLAVGHLCMDRIAYVGDFPEENSSSHIVRYEERPGGTAATAAAAAARLNLRAAYLSPLGSDETGEMLRTWCRNYGLSLDFCPEDQSSGSRFTNVIVNQKKDSRTFFSWHGTFDPMVFGEKERSVIRSARILHLDNTQPDNARLSAEIAREEGTLVSLDGSSLRKDGRLDLDYELASLADILITSEAYPTQLTGLPLREALLKLGEELHPKVLISTLGEKGCLLFREGKLWLYPSYPVPVVDTVGAGDAFHGGYLAAFLDEHLREERERISNASAVAALSVMAPGGWDGLPDREMRDAFLREKGYLEGAAFD